MTAEQINLQFTELNKQIDNLSLIKLASERAHKKLEDKKLKLENEFDNIEKLKCSINNL